jgi:3-methyladenine DNA glycosylase AlkD
MSQANELREYLISKLKEKSSEANRQTAQRFFKHEIQVYGVRSADVELIGKEVSGWIKNWTKEEVFTLAESLWKSGMLEETFLACRFSLSVYKKYEPEDIILFKGWIDKYIKNWASCDTFCNHTIGKMLIAFPEVRPEVISWSNSSNLWLRRASAVSYILPARKGMYLDDIFIIADVLLLDREDMVQKGYGWMLKVASASYLHEVFQFVISRKKTMPRTALRYAIEKMPAELKMEAMLKS